MHGQGFFIFTEICKKKGKKQNYALSAQMLTANGGKEKPLDPKGTIKKKMLFIEDATFRYGSKKCLAS
jgi:hypothetical protein